MSERDYSACSIDAVDGSCGGSATSAFGTFYFANDGFNQGYHVEGDQFVPGTVLFNFAPPSYYQRPDERVTLGALGHYELSEHADVYTQLMFMDNRTVAQFAPAGMFFDSGITIPCRQPAAVRTAGRDDGLHQSRRRDAASTSVGAMWRADREPATYAIPPTAACWGCAATSTRPGATTCRRSTQKSTCARSTETTPIRQDGSGSSTWTQAANARRRSMAAIRAACRGISSRRAASHRRRPTILRRPTS